MHADPVHKPGGDHIPESKDYSAVDPAGTNCNSSGVPIYDWTTEQQFDANAALLQVCGNGHPTSQLEINPVVGGPSGIMYVWYISHAAISLHPVHDSPGCPEVQNALCNKTSHPDCRTI